VVSAQAVCARLGFTKPRGGARGVNGPSLSGGGAVCFEPVGLLRCYPYCFIILLVWICRHAVSSVSIELSGLPRPPVSGRIRLARAGVCVPLVSH